MIKISKLQPSCWLKSLICQASLGLTTLLMPITVQASDTITFNYPPFGQFNVEVKDLATFAETGEISPSLNFYTKQATPEQLKKFRQFLNYPLPINSIEVYNFLNTDLGETILSQLSKIIVSPSNQSQPALSGALIQAAADPNGLKFINVLQKYTLPTIPLNVSVIEATTEQVEQFFKKTNYIFNQLDQIPENRNSNDLLQTLTPPGKATWTTLSLTIPRPNGDDIQGVVYLPQNNQQPAPLIVLAPGLNSDINALLYVGKHLASYGYSVAALNFPQTDNQRLQAALSGSEALPPSNAWMLQPKDVTLFLNKIEQKMATEPQWQGKINTQNVGLIGQSLGGYTVTALAGTPLSWSKLVKHCQDLTNPDRIILNPAVIWQCKNLDSPIPPANLADARVKAAIAINPVSNPIFSKTGMATLKTPMLVIAGSADIFSPAVPEQLLPFTWMTQSDRYLLLVKNSTHLSFLEGTSNLPEAILGPKPELARTYLNAVSLAFFNRYLKQQSQFDSSLTDAAIANFGQDPLPMRLLRSLSPETLNIPDTNSGFEN